MINIIKRSYLFLILFLLILLKEPLFKIFYLEENIYTPLKCTLLEDDYNRLLEFNNIDYVYDGNFINSKIIFKDIYHYLDEITIRGGKDIGLNNYPVVYDNTLIGLISSIKETTSIVKLLTNKESKISVKINDNIGILEYKSDKFIISGINNYSDIKVNDNVYTSGLGNLKANIYIGTVKNILIDNKGIEKIIEVDYKIDIKDIDYVTIIKETL